MAHAHPAPKRFTYNNDENDQTALRPRPLFHAANPTSSPSPIDPARDKTTPFGLQNRRLQLRNINFRGTILPSRRFSTQISIWTAGTIQTDKSEKTENSGSGTTTRRPTDADDSSPPTSGSVLQEINNSSKRMRLPPPRPSIASIFEDSDSPADPGKDSLTSWYQETSNHSTPVAFDSENDPCAMKSPPPLSSPLVKQVRGRKKSRMNLRSASYEQSKYIEHLESQLTIAQSKNDSQNVRGPVGKLRTITAENKCLKQELADWEERFDERVDDAVGKKIELESSMRGQIKSLEQDVESKDRKMKEMEWELERASQRLSDMESLEATNRILERRLDVLTELLAHYPTRPQHPLERISPFRLKTPRPKSMMPILASSEAVALSQRQSTTYSNSSTTISLSQANSPTLRMASGELETDFLSHKKMLSEAMGSLDSGLRGSCSMGSGQTSDSRPVSFMSNFSTSPSAWGPPLPGSTSPEMRSRQGNRNRKMRKFPSGSASLKPLILPTASAASTAMPMPASTAVFSPRTPPSRDVFGTTIDPTTSFLSKHSYDSLFDTPTQQRRRSSTWVEEDTLRILEGNRYDPLDQMESLDSAMSSQDITLFEPSTSSSLAESLEHHMETDYASSPPAEIQEPSFETEIEEHPHERTLREAEARSKNRFSVLEETSAETTIELQPSGSNLLEIGQDASYDDLAAFTEFASITTASKTPESDTIRRRHPSSNINSTPLPSEPSKTRPTPQPPPAKCSPLVSLVHTAVLGSFSRYTSYFKEARRDPTALAHRFITNIWRANWSRLGRLSWWVLGLFLGSSAREDLVDKSAVGEEFNWHYNSADASKARRVGSLETNLPDRSRLGLASNGGRPACPTSPKVTSDNHVLEWPRCNDCVESSFAQSIRLWAKFSFALVLAVGVAVKDGPESLSTDTDRRHRHRGFRKKAELSPSTIQSELEACRHNSPDHSEAVGGQSDTWSGKLTWIQNLGVADFAEGQR